MRSEAANDVAIDSIENEYLEKQNEARLMRALLMHVQLCVCICVRNGIQDHNSKGRKNQGRI